jgi:hypothetical protein
MRRTMLQVKNYLDQQPCQDWQRLKKYLGLDGLGDALINCNIPEESLELRYRPPKTDPGTYYLGPKAGTWLAMWLPAVGLTAVTHKTRETFVCRAWFLWHGSVDKSPMDLDEKQMISISKRLKRWIEKGWHMTTNWPAPGEAQIPYDIESLPIEMSLIREEILMLEHMTGTVMKDDYKLDEAERGLVSVMRQANKLKHPDQRFAERYGRTLAVYEEIAEECREKTGMNK